MEENIKRCVGERLRVLRISRGMSQRELGSNLGVTFQQIRKYEQGENCVACDRLCKISSILQVPVEYFFRNASANDFFNEERRVMISKKKGPKPIVLDNESALLVKHFNKIKDSTLKTSLLDLLKVHTQKRKVQ
ncbi:MAG: helix-turn-helix domain-containing protein [Rickettsiales bacterium]|jgi:transcriptional regulator with XRE-family HTH domain|nr:helix-turn-helix domain-containing protein [Rickettsiales bacterium]